MLTPCLGRERVHAQLDDALSSARWVSVVGPPGSGKTLLVRHLAAAHRASTWVNAQGLRTSDAILSACLHGARRRGGTRRLAPAAPWAGPSTAPSTLLVVDGVDIDADGLGPGPPGARRDHQRAPGSPSPRGPWPGSRASAWSGSVRFPCPGRHEPLAGPAVDLFLQPGRGRRRPPRRPRDPRARRTPPADRHRRPAPAHRADGRADRPRRRSPTWCRRPRSSEAVHASYELLDEDQQRCFRRLAQMTTPVSIDVLADIVGVERDEAAGAGRRPGPPQPPRGAARRPLRHAHPDPPARRLPHRLDRRRERSRARA